VINSGLSVMHINIRSILPKIDTLQAEAQPFDILIFTETWLSNSTISDDIIIQNFDPPLRKDRIGKSGGGVAIYIRSGILATRRHDLELPGLEALWVELSIQHKKFLIGGFYRPPSANNEYWSLLEESIDRAHTSIDTSVLITGDFKYKCSKHQLGQNIETHEFIQF